MSLLNKTLLPASLLLLTACSGLPTAVEVGEQTTIVPVSKNLLVRDKTYKRELDQPILKQEKGSYEIVKSTTITLLSGIDYDYLRHPSLNKGATVGIAKDEKGTVAACYHDAYYRVENVEFCVFDTNNDGVFNYGIYEGVEAAEIFVPYQINTNEKHIATRNYRKIELVFRGVSNNKIDFSYQEYAADMEEPTNREDFKIAFPKNSKVIFDYKGAKFEIISATNFGIKFRVLSHFNRL